MPKNRCQEKVLSMTQTWYGRNIRQGSCKGSLPSVTWGEERSKDTEKPWCLPIPWHNILNQSYLISIIFLHTHTMRPMLQSHPIKVAFFNWSFHSVASRTLFILKILFLLWVSPQHNYSLFIPRQPWLHIKIMKGALKHTDVHVQTQEILI